MDPIPGVLTIGDHPENIVFMRVADDLQHRLFRSTGVKSAKDFHEILEALNMDLDLDYFAGVSPRRNVYKGIWTSTDAPRPIIIGYHTELAYTSIRPEIIAFFCQTPSLIYGETCVFDTEAAYLSLSDGLKSKLHEGLQYRRYFVNRSSNRFGMNFRKSWQDVFGTTDKIKVGEILTLKGAKFNWTHHDDLYTQEWQPAIVTDQDGVRHLNMLLLDRNSWSLLLRRFRRRFSIIEKMLYFYLILRQRFSSFIFFETLHADETQFSIAESAELQEIFWSNCLLFGWREGDVIFLDNTKLAHGRMNFPGRRSILAALIGRIRVDNQGRIFSSTKPQ